MSVGDDVGVLVGGMGILVGRGVGEGNGCVGVAVGDAGGAVAVGGIGVAVAVGGAGVGVLVAGASVGLGVSLAQVPSKRTSRTDRVSICLFISFPSRFYL